MTEVPIAEVQHDVEYLVTFDNTPETNKPFDAFTCCGIVYDLVVTPKGCLLHGCFWLPGNPAAIKVGNLLFSLPNPTVHFYLPEN